MQVVVELRKVFGNLRPVEAGCSLKRPFDLNFFRGLVGEYVARKIPLSKDAVYNNPESYADSCTFTQMVLIFTVESSVRRMVFTVRCSSIELGARPHERKTNHGRI